MGVRCRPSTPNINPIGVDNKYASGELCVAFDDDDVAFFDVEQLPCTDRYGLVIVA